MTRRPVIVPDMETMPAVVVDDEAQLTARFAAALLRHPETPDGRFAAALSVTSDTGKALLMAHKLWDSPQVIEAQRQIKAAAEDDLDFIGTKADFAREVLECARKSWDGDVQHKMYKLYAEVRGFISKADTNVNVQVNNNKVMIVKDLGSNDDWERRAAEQQRKLIDVSASRH